MSSPALEPVTPRLVLKLALPAMGQLVLEGLVFMLDSIMLGQYSTTALAATRLNSALHWSLYTTLSSFTIGTIAVMGRAVGSADCPIMGAVVRSSLGLEAVVEIAQPFMATSITLEHTLRGAGVTRTAFWIAVMGWFVVRLSVTAIAVWYFHLGLVGIWIGSTCDWVVRALLLAWQFCRGRWYEVNV